MWQWIDSVFDSLKDHLGLDHDNGRTCHGARNRIGSKLLVLASGIWHNRKIGGI